MEAEVRLPSNRLVVPDISGWPVAADPDFVRVNPILRVPDWCCEVLSESNGRDDRRLKLPLYARSDVGWIWLVEPVARFVEVYQTRDGLPTLVHSAGDADSTVLPPFEGEISVAGWWESPAPATE